MLRFILIWYTRLRLWLIRRQRKEKWGPASLDVELLYQLAYIMNARLLAKLAPKILQEVYVNTLFNNASELLDWLFYVTKSVEAGEYIKDSIMLPRNYRGWIDLDTFLVNHKGGTVTPVEFQSALITGIDRLYVAISETNDQTYREYYHRKLRVHFPDIYSVLEGMLKASTSDYAND